jgi:hypothetical protein
MIVPTRIAIAFSALDHLHRVTLPMVYATGSAEGGVSAGDPTELDICELRVKTAACEVLRAYLSGEEDFMPKMPPAPPFAPPLMPFIGLVQRTPTPPKEESDAT